MNLLWFCAGLAAWLQSEPATAARSAAAEEVLVQETATGATGPLVQETVADFTLRLGGVIALDALKYDARNSRSSGLFLDRATLRVDGSTSNDDTTFRVGVDLRGIDTRHGLEEAWIGHTFGETRWRLGLFDIPLGFEAGFFEEDLPLPGYGFAPQLTGRTDWGVDAARTWQDGRLTAQASWTVGAGFNRVGEALRGPTVTARITAFPWWSDEEDAAWWSGAWFGVGASWTHRFRGSLDVVHPLRTRLYEAPRLEADAARFLSFTMGLDAGPLRLAWEAVPGEAFPVGSGYLDTRTAIGRADFDQIGAWQLMASWRITGGRYDSRPLRVREHGGVVPGSDKSRVGFHQARGALEASVRYANSDLDRDLIDAGLVDPTRSSQEFRVLAAGLRWLHPRGVVVSSEVVRTVADDDLVSLGGGGRDTSWLLRLQWTF